jgi:hypothetical protein
MNLEEIKKEGVFAQYYFWDIPPKKGLKPLQYYASIGKESFKFYIRFNVTRGCIDYLTMHSRQELEELVNRDKLIKFIPPVKLEDKEDLVQDKNGQIIKISGYGEDMKQEIIPDPPL